jgi:hypothetical protein
MKIRTLGAELFDARTDGRKDTSKLIVAFRKFTKAPKTVYLHFSQYTVYTLPLRQWLETRGQQAPGGPRLCSKASTNIRSEYVTLITLPQ